MHRSSFFLLSVLNSKCCLGWHVARWVQEEVVMKRCWLARYWALAVKNGEHDRLTMGGRKGGDKPPGLCTCFLHPCCKFWIFTEVNVNYTDHSLIV